MGKTAQAGRAFDLQVFASHLTVKVRVHNQKMLVLAPWEARGHKATYADHCVCLHRLIITLRVPQVDPCPAS
jgi:hypothetical protein